MTFSEREAHLRERAERGWVDDEDVRVCMEEIDRLNGIRATAVRDGFAASDRGLTLSLPAAMSADDAARVLVAVLREQERIRR